MTKEFEGLEEGPKAKIDIDLLRTTLKISNWKTPGWWNTWIMVQEIHLHSRQINTQNERMPTRSTRTRSDDQRKDHIDLAGTPQRNRPKQLQSHNLPTDDMENINSTNKGRDLLLAYKLRIFPEEQKGCRKGSRCTEELFYIDQHIPNESKTRQKNLAMAWIDYKKAYDMVP